ncbi:hypothetical protein [Bradyrhizobium sp. USDA 10063]
MAMIYVRARPGRRAYYEGRVIPHDQFIPVIEDPYIRRLITVWDDLEVEGAKPKAKPSQQPPAPQPAKAKE